MGKDKIIGLMGVGIVCLFCAMLFSSHIHKQTIQHMEEINKIDREALRIQTEEVVRLEVMIERDDRLLDQFMHGSWSRDCDYELVAGVLLADGSIRSSLIQHCEER